MKYEVEIQGRELSIELEQRNGRVQARLGERDYDFEVLSPEDGIYTFLLGDRVYEVNVWASEPNSLRVRIGNNSFLTKIIDRKQRRPTIEHGTEGRQNLIAPMPGKVVRLLLSAGDEVIQGQGVIVVEAMKMQNEIKSPKSGHIVEVRVIEGATVNAGQVLAVVE
jgi:biotin carboxyl carrier protein